MKNHLQTLVCSAALSCFLAMPAVATTYEISVDVESGAIDDLDIVASYLDAADDGAQAGRGVRKTASALAGEVGLLANDRMDDYGVLTLDDGTQVQLADDDMIELKPKHNGSFHRARIKHCFFFDNGVGHSGKKRRFHRLPSLILNTGHPKGLRIPSGVVKLDDINYPCNGLKL